MCDQGDNMHNSMPVTNNTNEYNTVKEGKANVLFPHSVFYNPVQEFNRDLTIAVINAYSLQKSKELTVHSKKLIDNSEEESNINNDTGIATEELSSANMSRLKILEGLAASGLRSVRFALEIIGEKTIIANDYDRTAVDFINKNIEINNVCDIVEASNCDAAMLMYEHRRSSERFDVIDLDPYGSPAIFLDSSVQAVSDGGLLCVTCTDAAVLCGNASETCYSKYGAVSLRTKYCHEMALRIILQSIESHANRYSRYIVPVLSLSIDFYVRVFVKVFTGQGKVKQSLSKLSLVYHCTGCGTHHLQPMGVKTPRNGNNFKYGPAVGPVIGQKCSNCGGSYHIGGPIWSDPIHDVDFVTSVVDYVSKNSADFKTSSRITGMLSLAIEELPDVPLYYITDAMCNVVHCVVPTLIQIRSAVLNAGYRVSLSHAQSGSLKTDAPPHILWDIIRCWVKEHPVKESRLIPGTPTKRILEKEPSIQADFTEHAEANPKSRQKGLVRFQLNPEPEWGPRPRAKRVIEGLTTDGIIQATVEKRTENQNRRKILKRTAADSDYLKSFPCKRYALGECDNGDDCSYSHEKASHNAAGVTDQENNESSS